MNKSMTATEVIAEVRRMPLRDQEEVLRAFSWPAAVSQVTSGITTLCKPQGTIELSNAEIQLLEERSRQWDNSRPLIEFIEELRNAAEQSERS